MKCIIVDDENIVHDIIQSYCDNIDNIQIVGSFTNSIEAFSFVEKNAIDLIFLDINIPNLDGLAFIKSLQKKLAVIIITAHQEHALTGYELGVTDYLLKPFSFDRFFKAIQKVKQFKHEDSKTHSSNLETHEIFIKVDKKHVLIKSQLILYIEALGNYCKIYLLNETFVVREKISHFRSILPEDYFLQVHKSFIINKYHLKYTDGVSVQIMNFNIPIGSSYKNAFYTKIGLLS